MPASSKWLVLLQLSLIAALLATGPWLARAPVWLVLQCAGIALGAWAVASLPLRQLRVTPEPAPAAELVTRGPFRLIRHPMYLAVLMAAAALAADAFSWPRLGIWLALAVVLHAKLAREEALLAAAFPAYADYRRRTWRLLPGLW